MDEKKVNILIFLATLSAGVLLISNLAAVKLWNFFGVAVDGGIVIFPISYILSDVVMELFGRKVARNIIWSGLLLNILAVLIFVIVGALPEFAEWGLQDSYQAILGFTPRIVAGSLLAYLVSQLTNNFLFEKIKQKTGEKYLFVRSLGSSMISRMIDLLIFEVVAFFGVLSFQDFLFQMIFAYVAGFALEALLTPITYMVVKMLKKYKISNEQSFIKNKV